MTVKEAIKRLKEITDYLAGLETRNDLTAVRLGVGALKRICRDRQGIITFPDELLPGETKE